jgi:hypothetical protein
VGPVSTAFTFATLVMTAVVMLAYRMDHKAGVVAGIGVLMLLGFGLGRLLSLWLDPPWSMGFYPVEDLMIMSLCWYMWVRHPEWWKLALAIVFLVQLGVHAAFWLSGDQQTTALRTYILANNLAFAFELLILTVTGAGHVAVLVRDRFLGTLVGGGYHLGRHP